MSPGEKRRRKAKREREQAAYAAAVSALPTGSCCCNCAHRGTMPLSRKPICTLDSDFAGYTVVELMHVCPRWTTK